MMMIVGSNALKFRRPAALHREPNDLDIIGRFDTVQAYIKSMRFPYACPTAGGKKYVARGLPETPIHDIEIAWNGTLAAQLLEMVEKDPQTTREFLEVQPGRHLAFLVPSLDVLYMLKMSHRYLKNSPYFAKTMTDIRNLRDAGAMIPKEYEEWYKARLKETYNYKHPNLNQSKDGFFNGDGVHYVYDHDSIHWSVRLDERGPAYAFFKKDQAEVACDKEKFYSIKEYLRLASVVEESMVLAIERSLVPHPGVLTPRQAFMKALEKVCTSITSGWWREYAWEHYDEAVSTFDRLEAKGVKFWEIFQQDAVDGKVKLYSGSAY